METTEREGFLSFLRKGHVRLRTGQDASEYKPLRPTPFGRVVPFGIGYAKLRKTAAGAKGHAPLAVSLCSALAPLSAKALRVG